ncbi:MAG TPA: glucosylceramidase [Clostridiales bacterium UBA8960]|nr:glucosylceramidase [Clostridiales bacterium UBA8960]
MSMKIIQTRYEGGVKTTTENDALFESDISNQETNIINLYPTEVFQTLIGFGGAFTESAGFVFSKVSDETQQKLIEDYFGESGLGYTLGRCPVDSCDFSLGNYSAISGGVPGDLSGFTLERDEKYIFPLLQKATEVASSMKLILSPWSPPAYMKSNGEKNKGGTLLPEYRRTWAAYLCKYILEYKERGYDVFALSVQNEPNAVQRWDSCLYTPEEERAFVRDDLAVEMKKSGLEDVKITIWDHNKERLFDRTDYICSDKTANAAVGAVGFHWYSGDHFEAIELVRRKYPDKALIFTEGCIEYSKFSADSQLTNAQMYAHEIIGSLNAGMNAFIDWNLYLDEKGGPNHVDNLCDAPIMIDYEKGNLIYNLSYDYIGHFSKFIKPGAVRIGLSRFTDQIEVTAFKNKDASIIAVLLNRTKKTYDCFIRLGGQLAKVTVVGESITTLLVSHNES